MENQERILKELLEIKSSIREMDKSIQNHINTQNTRIERIEKNQELIVRNFDSPKATPADFSDQKPTNSEEFKIVEPQSVISEVKAQEDTETDSVIVLGIMCIVLFAVIVKAFKKSVE